MKLLKYFLSIIIFSVSLIANHNIVNDVANLSANALYNLDEDQAIMTLKPYMQQHPEIKAIKIIDNTDDSIFAVLQYKNNKIIHTQTLLNNYSNLLHSQSKIVYNNEEIGKIDIYYTKTNTLNLSNEEMNFIQKHIPIHYVYDPNWKPFEFRNEINEHDGMIAEILQIIKNKTKLNFIPVNVKSWKEAKEFINNKKADMFSAVSETDKRKTYLNFPKKSILNYNAVLISKKGNTCTDFKQCHKTVGIKKGYVLTDFIKKNYPNLTIIDISSTADGFTKLEQDAIDFYLNNSVIANYYINHKGFNNLTVAKELDYEFHLKIALRKELPTIILDIIDKALNAIPTKKKKQIYYSWVKGKQDTQKVKLTIKEKDWINSHIVTVGVENWMPVVFSNTGKDIDGICGDFTKKIIERTGLQIKVVNDTWNKLLMDFKDKKIDLLPATYYTDARAKYGLYSDGYFKMKDSIYFKSTTKGIHSLKDLEGKTLAIPKGYGTIDKLKATFPKINLVFTKDLDDSINRVLNGRVTAFYEGQIAAQAKIDSELIKGLSSVSVKAFKAPLIYYFSNIDEPILRSIIQKGLKSITYQEKYMIMSKWVGSNQKILLTQEEQTWLDKHIKIKYAFDPNWKPFEWADEVREHKGIVSDIIKLIEQKSDINIEPIYSKSWADVLFKIKHHTADMFLTGEIPNSDKFNFTTHTILTSPYVFISRVNDEYLNGFESLKNKKVGVFKASTIDQLLSTEKPDLKLIKFTNDETALEMIKNNQLDVAILSANLAKYYINIHGYNSTLKIAYKTKYNLNLKFAMDKSLGIIPIHIIDKALEFISEKEISDIIDKWTDLKIQNKTDWVLLWQIGAVVLLIIIFMIWNNRRLNLMVKEKTADIEQQKKELENLSTSLELKVKERTKELDSERKLISSIVNSQDSIVVTSDGKVLKTINQAFKDFYNLDSIDDFEKKYGPCICDSFEKNVSSEYLKKDMDGTPWVQYMLDRPSEHFKVLIKKDTTPHIFSISLDSFIFEDQKFVTVVLNDITDLEEAKQQVEAIHKHTRESIEYASLIQGALIPQHGAMEPFFKDHFVTWTPKDTVGGDIWLFNKLRHKDECLLFFIDCTGHGVPGAFVTMIVKSIEREIVSNIKKHPEFDISPAIIMGYFNKTMKKLLRQENEDSLSNAGWDGGIIYYNRRTQILKFAGAETPLFYIDENNQLQTIKGNRYSVGYKKCDPNYQYKETIINVQEGMKFFCTTDGYLDQNGGPKDFPFGKKRFSNIIQEYHNEPMAELQTIFQMKMMEWESMIPNNDRNDDITVIGFTIDSKSEFIEDTKEEIVKYDGVMTQNVIATAIDNIEAKISNVGIMGTISTITIEYCQNMMNYSKGIRATDSNDTIVPAGSIEVQYLNEEYYEIMATNIISKDDKEKIEPKLEEIKQLDKAGIKKRYKELRRSGENTHGKGGGIGLYEIAKVSNSIEYKFKAINEDKYYFTMKSIVKPIKREKR